MGATEQVGCRRGRALFPRLTPYAGCLPGGDADDAESDIPRVPDAPPSSRIRAWSTVRGT
jgi:hypothetical protein